MKLYRIGTEGQTTDGRKIQRDWIAQMAKSFNPQIYGARIWLEHLRGVYPDGPFRAYGDVKSLHSREVDGGKLALFAEIDPTPDLVAIVKARQKVYTSMEIDPDFAGTGIAYLVGLGVTDSPASLGTEMLTFSAGAAVNPLAGRKQKPGNLFAEALPLDWEAEDAPGDDDDDDSEADWLARVRSLFSRTPPASSQRESAASPPDYESAIRLLAERQAGTERLLSEYLPLASFAAHRADFEALANQFAALKTDLERAPIDRQPPRATGGPNTVLAKF